MEGHANRKTIMPADVVFDPTREPDLPGVIGDTVNLFGGITLEPVRATARQCLTWPDS